MNGRSLLTFISVLFLVGIFWMIAAIPEGKPSKTDLKLFEPVAPVPKEVAVAPKTQTPSEEEAAIPEKKEATPPKKKIVAASQKKERVTEEPKPIIPEAVSDEPPELVAYTPRYGSVTFTHLMHIEDYEIDCGECHHEDMEGGMSKCSNCHEPPKRALHKNCQGCHKQLKNDGKDSGPTGCRDCHTKASS
ncbi:MAG: hypothetical protein GTO12_16240 [Proteobacteria bacterium]|nr:hypothetical protein [Pseudomonadota bacterium]